MVIYLKNDKNIEMGNIEINRSNTIIMTEYGYNGTAIIGKYEFKVKRENKQYFKNCKNFEEFKRLEELYGFKFDRYKHY